MHRANAYLSHAWLIGYRHKPFLPGWYQFVDIDRLLRHVCDRKALSPIEFRFAFRSVWQQQELLVQRVHLGRLKARVVEAPTAGP